MSQHRQLPNKQLQLRSPASSRPSSRQQPQPSNGQTTVIISQNKLHTQQHNKPQPGQQSSNAQTKLSLAQRMSVQSRVFRSSHIPQQLRDKLSRDPWFWADELMANKHINDVWAHYDLDGDGNLSKKECQILGRDAVDRLLHKYKEMVMSEKQCDTHSAMKVTLNDSQTFLPCKSIDESKQKVADRLYRELDVGSDGTVSRAEFLYQWPRSCKKLLTIQQHKSMGCIII